MKNRTLFTTALASTAIAGLLTFASVTHASPEKSDKRGHANYSQMSDADKSAKMEKRLNRMAAKLGLSDQQKTQLQALKLNSKNEIKPLRNEMRTIRKEIRTLDPTAADYSAKLADASNRQAELSRQMTIAKGTQRQQMASILTTEQLAKFKEMKHKRKRGKHGGKRGHKKGNKVET